ncbi:MAG: flagellar basal-body rod protein FlgB [Acidobacteria bacterium 13_1_40CM_2_56_11]|nr:MAG: flagellar basal-body rod protein FlgB [Acidobacteria bacterium 13_1_40CM_2_56_11]
MINPSNAPFFPAVEELLSWTSKRQQALAGNVANMDTPGYRAQDYSFEQELATIHLSTTTANHIAPLKDEAHARLYAVNSKVKPNGNNVDLEREMTEITKNGLQYITLVQYLNQKIRTLRAAINEGGKV